MYIDVNNLTFIYILFLVKSLAKKLLQIYTLLKPAPVLALQKVTGGEKLLHEKTKHFFVKCFVSFLFDLFFVVDVFEPKNFYNVYKKV